VKSLFGYAVPLSLAANANAYVASGVRSETMTALLKNYGRPRGPYLALALFAVFASTLAAGRPALAIDTFTVILDQAKVMKLPERTATIVVGNPLIADISVQTGGIMVVTGKGYGITNLIAMDARGNTLMEQAIEVQAPRESVIVMHRGVERESYSCTPRCERRIMLGDTAAFFDATLAQTNRRDSQAQGASPAATR